MVDTPGETPAVVAVAPAQTAEAAPQAAEVADRTRESGRALATEVLESNSRETRELIQGLAALRTFVNGNEYSGDEKSKKIALKAITDAMVVLGDIKAAEDPSNLNPQSLESALRQLDDAGQNFVEIVEHKRHGLKGKPVVETIKAAFDEKHRALDALRANAATGLVESAPAPAVATDAPATAPAEAPEVPATPEQTAHKEAIDLDAEASDAIYQKIDTLSTTFLGQMQALRATIPSNFGLGVFSKKDDEARTSIDGNITAFRAQKKTFKDTLKQADDLRKNGDLAGAKTAMTTLQTNFDTMITNAETTITEKLNDTEIKENDECVRILTALQGTVQTAKTEFPPLLTARTTTIDGVATAKTALDEARQQPLEEVQQVVTLAQQPPPPEEGTDAPPPSDEEVADMTMEQFTETLQTSWEKMGEAMEGKKWGAVLGALLGMLGLIMARLKSMDSLDDWTSFFEGFGEEEAGTPEGAPEKPTTQAEVLAQFGIEAEGERGQFADLKAADVVRFVQQDGILPAGELAYPQPLVDFKASQAEAYGKFKAQLELNGLTAYYEALSEADKPEKTLGHFITHRFTSEATKAEGWKIA